MREEKHVCHRYAHQSFLQSPSGGRRSFLLTGSRPHYAPDLPFRMNHLKLEVEVDPIGKRLQGVATYRVTAVAESQTALRLDQMGLRIESVTVQGKKTPFETGDQSLRIALETPPQPGEEIEFSVSYSVQDPKRGLYFIAPDRDYPGKLHQVYSQGQDEDNRYWFPAFDYPNQKVATELMARVPAGYTAISNGALISSKQEKTGNSYHYRLAIPQVTYLVTLVVGQFEEIRETGPRQLPIQYFTPKGREADTKRAFGNTPQMIEAFERKTGVPYPYEKYSQVAVQDFIFGGMENTSATTQTDLVLHDERAHLDFSGDPLVSHELAHQWFGDLLTCRDWSHGWLNEGFATFMERVWIEENKDPDGGHEEAKYYTYQDWKEYVAEDSGRYRRPIVCNQYLEPIDLFDAHLYQKGGLVLNLIRGVLGEQGFWKAIRLYLERHREKSVETLDLIRAIEDATGKNLRRLFDEWVFGDGYPEFELSYEWKEPVGHAAYAELVIEQKQAAPKEGEAKIFHLPAILEFTFADGKTQRQQIELKEARERVFVQVAQKPVRVRFDPGWTIPKTLKFTRPQAMLIDQLKSDPDCMGRIEAAHELKKTPDARALEALQSALLADSFWGVQAEIAEALAETRTDAAHQALVAGLQVKHPKARRAIVRALAAFPPTEESVNGLRALAEKDPSYFVEADATRAWARSALRPSSRTALADEKKVSEVESFLLKQFKKESYRGVMQSAVLSGLSMLPGMDRMERPAALELVLRSCERGRPADERSAAVEALGQIGSTAVPALKRRITEVFSSLADENDFRLRMSLLRAIQGAGLVETIPALERIRATDGDGRVKRGSLVLQQDLQSSGSAPEGLAGLKAMVEKLQDENQKIKAQLEELGREKGRSSS